MAAPQSHAGEMRDVFLLAWARSGGYPTMKAHYNDSCKNGPFGLLPAQLHYRPTFWRDKCLN